MKKTYVLTFAALVLLLAPRSISAPEAPGLPSFAQLQQALKTVVSAGGSAGFALNMWATIVNRDGELCAGPWWSASRSQPSVGRWASL